ncbi:hypothetical protein H5410_045332 [Solanum commersonii]|uniref:Uncharacterized protein n=1 Tax=Solanum commersonii TaxID=4109 RepID=A0A9J5XAT8_SOLCO|nr:hypothetical protein H5410_045332 [Solanum commersonii]
MEGPFGESPTTVGDHGFVLRKLQCNRGEPPSGSASLTQLAERLNVPIFNPPSPIQSRNPR